MTGMRRVQRVELPNGRYVYEDTPNSAHVLYHQVGGYFEHGLSLTPGMTVFDIGANIGLFTLESLHRTGGRIQAFCFEPAPLAFDCLRRCLTEQFPLADITCLNVGVSASAGAAPFYYRPAASAMSSFEKSYVLSPADIDLLAATAASLDFPAEYLAQIPKGFAWLPFRLRRLIVAHMIRRVVAKTVPVRCALVRLSQVILAHQVDRIDVLKIDVEGAEWDVLQGIEPDDWQRIQAIAIEIHDIDGRMNEIESLFHRQGFTFVRRSQDSIFQGTTVFNLLATRSGNK